MALGSAVLGRPAESEESRGVKAALDDVSHGSLVPAVPVRPVRTGIGKGLGQRDRDCSLATSVRVAEERHEWVGRLCDVIVEGIADDFARESESCLTDLGKLRVFVNELVVNELEGLSDRERRRRVVALRSFLEAGYSVNTPAGAAILAEIPAALL